MKDFVKNLYEKLNSGNLDAEVQNIQNCSDIDSIVTDRDKKLRLIKNNDSLITIDTALIRCHAVGKKDPKLKGVANHFANLIVDILDNMEIAEYNNYYSFQDLINDHYNNYLQSNFETSQLEGNMPHLCYADSCYSSILDYARDMSVVGKDSVRYTIKDFTGVDILADKYEKYLSSKSILVKYGMPDEVCEYLGKYGISVNKEDIVSEQLSDTVMGEE